MGYEPRHRAERARIANGMSKAVSRRAVTAPVAIAATAAVIAVPLAVAAPASAATNHTWNRLAMCESGQRWHVDTGNGYYGGVQFSASTWLAYGGGKYAHVASNASRWHQVITAQKVLHHQGWGAWPACSAKLGLTRKDARAPLGGRPGHSGKAHHGHHHAAPGHYVVKAGDTLSKIARRHDVAGGWHALYRMNRAVIGKDPNRLRIGEHLRLR